MPIPYRIEKVGPSLYVAHPVSELPSWSFTSDEDEETLIAVDAMLSQPADPGGVDLSDVTIRYHMNNPDAGSGSLRG